MRWIFFLFISALSALEPLPSFCNYDARFDAVKKYREGKQIFIETGTAGGQGIFMGLHAGFSSIYTIEFSDELHALARRRAGHLPSVHLYHGDSATVLQKILPSIQESALFWLDAHYNGPGLGKQEEKCPLLRELEAIKNHPINTHTILIDDVRQFGTAEFDFLPLSRVIESLKAINPDYEIRFEDGYVAGDVLVARVSK